MNGAICKDFPEEELSVNELWAMPAVRKAMIKKVADETWQSSDPWGSEDHGLDGYLSQIAQPDENDNSPAETAAESHQLAAHLVLAKTSLLKGDLPMAHAHLDSAMSHHVQVHNAVNAAAEETDLHSRAGE